MGYSLLTINVDKYSRSYKYHQNYQINHHKKFPCLFQSIPFLHIWLITTTDLFSALEYWVFWTVISGRLYIAFCIWFLSDSNDFFNIVVELFKSILKMAKAIQSSHVCYITLLWLLISHISVTFLTLMIQ